MRHRVVALDVDKMDGVELLKPEEKRLCSVSVSVVGEL